MDTKKVTSEYRLSQWMQVISKATEQRPNHKRLLPGRRDKQKFVFLLAEKAETNGVRRT